MVSKRDKKSRRGHSCSLIKHWVFSLQARKIQDNCISQLERIRESYTNQTKNLSEFCGYSAQQITTLRDQYQDQVRRSEEVLFNHLTLSDLPYIY